MFSTYDVIQTSLLSFQEKSFHLETQQHFFQLFLLLTSDHFPVFNGPGMLQYASLAGQDDVVLNILA